MLFFFIIFATNPVVLDTDIAFAKVSEQGIILQSDSHYSHYNHEGKLMVQIPTSYPGRLEFFNDYYLLHNYKTFGYSLLNKSGKQLPHNNMIGLRPLKQLGKNRFASIPFFATQPHLNSLSDAFKDAFKNGQIMKIHNQGVEPMPTMINLFKVLETEEEVTFQLERSFFRATERQRATDLNFKEFFLTEIDQVFYVMTQLDDEIFVYDEETIERERLTDPRATFERYSIPLALTDFIPSTEKSSKLQPIYFSRSDLNKDLNKVDSDFSKIIYFDKTDLGFVVVYQSPSKDRSKNPTAMDLYVQRVDQQGNNIAPPAILKQLEGEFAGMVKHKLYWFSKNATSKKGSLLTFELNP